MGDLLNKKILPLFLGMFIMIIANLSIQDLVVDYLFSETINLFEPYFDNMNNSRATLVFVSVVTNTSIALIMVGIGAFIQFTAKLKVKINRYYIYGAIIGMLLLEGIQLVFNSLL